MLNLLMAGALLLTPITAVREDLPDEEETAFKYSDHLFDTDYAVWLKSDYFLWRMDKEF